MRKPTPLSEGAEESLATLLKQTKTKSEFQRVQCIWLRASLGLSAPQVATAIGWNVSSVRRLQSHYLHEAEAALKVAPRGGRYHENMSLEEEKALLSPFLEKAKKGGVLVVSEIKTAYEERVGHKVPKSTVYRMLARHGWRKIAPRPYHPKVDLVKQEEFKKNPQNRKEGSCISKGAGTTYSDYVSRRSSFWKN
jgi:transposase